MFHSVDGKNNHVLIPFENLFSCTKIYLTRDCHKEGSFFQKHYVHSNGDFSVPLHYLWWFHLLLKVTAVTLLHMVSHFIYSGRFPK